MDLMNTPISTQIIYPRGYITCRRSRLQLNDFTHTLVLVLDLTYV
jgi:hypothetical protein